MSLHIIALLHVHHLFHLTQLRWTRCRSDVAFCTPTKLLWLISFLSFSKGQLYSRSKYCKSSNNLRSHVTHSQLWENNFSHVEAQSLTFISRLTSHCSSFDSELHWTIYFGRHKPDETLPLHTPQITLDAPKHHNTPAINHRLLVED